MRPLPPPPAPDLTAERASVAAIEVEVALITRLFGGGARARTLDERSWLRSAACKGALRAWWRAGYAHRFSSLAALRAAEARLFGAAARFEGEGILGGPGLVEVEVRGAQKGSLQPQAYEPEGGDALNLAYFPAARQEGRGVPAARLGLPVKGAKAKLVVRIGRERSDADCEAILNALRLWLVLGGVGARTRRGAGALGVAEEEPARGLGVPVSAEDLRRFLLRWLRPGGAVHDHPGLWDLAHGRAVFVGERCESGEEAQRRLSEVLRELRQDRRHPKDWMGARDWGRSRWPEADAIRLRAGVAPGWRHQPDPKHRDRYPRSALGLPIVVHFKDAPPRGLDPEDFTISAARPEGKGWARVDRFASPLLLRPVQVWEKEERCFLPVAWLGPFTLPGTFRPLVEPKAGLSRSAGELARHVVETFEIGAAQDEVFARLEALFTRARFSRLNKESP